MQAASLKVAQSQEFKDYLATQVYDPLPGDGASFSRIVREGLAKWAAVVKEREIKVEQ